MGFQAGEDSTNVGGNLFVGLPCSRVTRFANQSFDVDWRIRESVRDDDGHHHALRTAGGSAGLSVTDACGTQIGDSSDRA